MTERLNRFLARSGVASRREADRLIASGAVLVNGKQPPADGMLIEAGDKVSVDGRPVEVPEGHRYLVMNKPVGVVVSARDDARRRTVFDLLAAGGESGRRLFAVGRLDLNSSGLLVLTDDGDLTQLLAHPRHAVTKEYVAVVKGSPDRAALRKLRRGVELEDGVTQPAAADVVAVGGGVATLRVVIREGRNRQVRRMLEAVGHPVMELQRTALGPLRLGRLRAGTWRVLRPGEIEALRRAAGR